MENTTVKRDEKEFVTKTSGTKIVHKAYLTYRETKDILKNKDLSDDDRGNALVNIAIISVNGVSEGVGELLQDLPLPDYLEIQQELAKLIKGDFQTTK